MKGFSSIVAYIIFVGSCTAGGNKKPSVLGGAHADCPDCVCTSIIEKDVFDYRTITNTATETLTITSTSTTSLPSELAITSLPGAIEEPVTVTEETTVTITSQSTVGDLVTVPTGTTTSVSTITEVEVVTSPISTCADEIISISTSRTTLPCTI